MELQWTELHAFKKDESYISDQNSKVIIQWKTIIVLVEHLPGEDIKQNDYEEYNQDQEEHECPYE